MGLINAVIPNIKAMLLIFEPITFPIAISLFPSSAEPTLTTNSGLLVPNATTVKPTTSGEIPD
jgi:hypothetical protein